MACCSTIRVVASDTESRVLVTLHMPMSIRTFNAVLAAVADEWPHSYPAPHPDDPHAVQIRSEHVARTSRHDHILARVR